MNILIRLSFCFLVTLGSDNLCADDAIHVWYNNTSIEDFPTLDCFDLILDKRDSLSLNVSPSQSVHSSHFPHINDDFYGLRYTDVKSNELICLLFGVYKSEVGISAKKLPQIKFYKDKTFKATDKNVYILLISNLDKIESGKGFPDMDCTGLHKTRNIIFSPGLHPNTGKPILKLHVHNPSNKPHDPTHPDHRSYKSDFIGQQEIEEGKILWIGDYPHKVTKIVYPDPKIQLRGWVEIEQRTKVK